MIHCLYYCVPGARLILRGSWARREFAPALVHFFEGVRAEHAIPVDLVVVKCGAGDVYLGDSPRSPVNHAFALMF